MDDIEKIAREMLAGCITNTGYVREEYAINAIIAALSAAPQGAPDGWVLVPVEPTEEMIWGARDVKVGGHCYVCSKDDASEDDARGVWSAMLAAKPEPKA